jgi:putative two-component system response regulator
LNISNYTNIISTTHSIEVLEICKKEQPDLILLDLKMPVLDGFQVLEQLKSEKIDYILPVLIVTAQNDYENRIKALDLGAKDFIGKPFDQTEVIIRIKNILEISLLHKEAKEYNRHLEMDVLLCNKGLQEAQQELIHRLVLASEFRDYETANHIIRISYFTYELGKAVGLSEGELDLLLHASTMHDIGKVGIPDSILLKPGKLNLEEWEIMKTHTTKGAQILRGSSFELIRMKGEEIPLVGRITAISDVFDALVSERPYKKAWPIEKALEEIRTNSGSHFDEDLVEKFFEILPTILEIQTKYE